MEDEYERVEGDTNDRDQPYAYGTPDYGSNKEKEKSDVNANFYAAVPEKTFISTTFLCTNFLFILSFYSVGFYLLFYFKAYGDNAYYEEAMDCDSTEDIDAGQPYVYEAGSVPSYCMY